MKEKPLMNEAVFVRSRLLHAEAQQILMDMRDKLEVSEPETMNRFTALMLRSRAAENLAFGRLMLAKAYLKSARRVEAELQ
jgi:hypothetical protein